MSALGEGEGGTCIAEQQLYRAVCSSTKVGPVIFALCILRECEYVERAVLREAV